MEILNRQPKTWGRFFDLLTGKGNRSTGKSVDSTERVSLTMRNEVLGNWLCTHKQPLANVLRRMA
jgi:hypothetical protein